MSNPDVIEVTVKISPSGDEFPMEIYTDSTGNEIIETLIEAEEITPSKVDGTPQLYNIAIKGGGQLALSKTVQAAGVRSGDKLIVVPFAEAG